MLERLVFMSLLCFGFSLLFGAFGCSSDQEPVPGSPAMPLRYDGPSLPYPSHPDGGLRPVVGVHNYQVMRASRVRPELQDDYGYTYNHQPMLAYWKGKFYLEYLSAPRDEVFNSPADSSASGKEKPCHTLLAVSSDGRNWSKPVVVFPAFELPDGSPTIAHQRMGFYVAPGGRLLVLAFYGTPSGPNDGKGVGRVIREIYEDGTFGPVYFIRYNRHAGWDESNTPYPFYTEAQDAGFVQACTELLANKLVTLQWWEEDRSQDGFYSLEGVTDYSGKSWESRFSCKAFSFWHRKDGKVVGIWKGAWAALSEDEGRTWSQPVEALNIAKTNAKHWGQRLDDGRYVLSYCPQDGWNYRWPLALIQSDDGITFRGMLAVHGEVPVRRYPGKNKDLGAQYVRGIVEGNGNPPGSSLWLTYSVNKEDIWVAQVPVPIRSSVEGPVADDFEDMAPGLPVPGWNVYSPRWASVSIIEEPDSGNHALRLTDGDPYDYARVVRVFPESAKANVSFRILPQQAGSGRLEIDVIDSQGRRPVRLALAGKGRIYAGGQAQNSGQNPVGTYTANSWLNLGIEVDAAAKRFGVIINGTEVVTDAPFAQDVDSVERISFRSGEYREVELEHLRKWEAGGIDPATDYPLDPVTFLIDDFRCGERP